MAMTERYRRLLERNGWKVGTVAEFLNLTPEESALIELQLTLSSALKAARVKSKLSQVALAKLIGSSQSRVAKMESGDPSVSLDLILRALLALGHDVKIKTSPRRPAVKRKRAA